MLSFLKKIFLPRSDLQRTKQQTIKNNIGTAINIGGDASLIIQHSQNYEELKEKIAEAQLNVNEYPDNPRFQKQLAQAYEELEDFETNVSRLYADINQIPINTERGKIARSLFEQGKFNEAREALDDKKMASEAEALLKKRKRLQQENEENEQQLSNLAVDYFLKARLTTFDYSLGERRISKASKLFETALELNRKPEYLFGYANFLARHHFYANAEALYKEALAIYRQLATANTQIYQPDVAMTLHNLANLLAKDSSQHKNSEAHYNEALTIYRQLAAVNPQVYQSDVADTLNNLAALLTKDSSQRKDAEKHYNEALEIRHQLATANPQVYQPNVAATLNNLAALLAKDSSRRKDAEKHYKEALRIRRQLAAINLQVYQPDVAVTLNNLAALLTNDSNRRTEAEAHYNEALKIRRQLAAVNPQIYQPDMAATLNNLANLLAHDSSQRKDAEAHYNEALTIYRQLATANQQVYQPNIAIILTSMGVANSRWKKFDQATSCLNKAKYFFEILSGQAPEVFKSKLDSVNQLLQQAKENFQAQEHQKSQ